MKNNMEYNTQLHVGNKVRIKSKEWFDMCGYYSIDAMQQYCGKICTISSIDDDGIISLKEDSGVWCWEERMFDLIEDEKEEKPLYHKGDKVKIKSKEWYNTQKVDSDGDLLPSNIESPICFFATMEKYCGEVFTIRSIDTAGIIKLEGNRYEWQSWMFDLVDEEEKEEEFQYKVGDKVVINSIDWYNANKNDNGEIARDGIIFNPSMKEYCGKVFTINCSYKEYGHIYYYLLEVGYSWSSWMFSHAKEDLLPNMKMSTTVIDGKIIAKDYYNNYQSNSSKFNLTKIIL